jgi:hypothetical protein
MTAAAIPKARNARGPEVESDARHEVNSATTRMRHKSTGGPYSFRFLRKALTVTSEGPI